MAKVDIFQSRSKKYPIFDPLSVMFAIIPWSLGAHTHVARGRGSMLYAGNFLEEKLRSRNLKLCGHFFIFEPPFSLGQKLKIQKVNFF